MLPPGGDWMETVVPVGRGDEGFDVSPDGKEAWVANAGDGTVSIVDLDAKRVTATLPLDVQSANRLKFTPDGKLVLISMLGQGDLLVVDTATHQPVKRIPIGHGAAGILVEPNGARAFVACTPDNYVAVIDLKTLTVTGHIQAGGGPDGEAWAVRQQ
jgi:YVTN family beta-propeller protein